jgi:uncharacterized repeat protein (TIGR03803 family)
VFKLNKNRDETVLYSFAGGSDGANPYGNLIRDASGNLYGTTYRGGVSGYGTVFKLSKSGEETVLYSFNGGTTDGCNPFAGLLRDKAGSLYGTTVECGASGDGTVFKLDANGKENVLHSFGGSDGANPGFASLLMDTRGNLYGDTNLGGDLNCNSGYGCGVIYKLSKTGTLTLLHEFAGGSSDGCYAVGTMAMDGEGNLYGTAAACGASGNGIVWKLSTSGTEAVLHNFAGGSADGALPVAGVIMDAKGNLYGDTYEGGPLNVGTVYKVSRIGKLTLLHKFAGRGGEFPNGILIRDATGSLYGTASGGGRYRYGTVFKVDPAAISEKKHQREKVGPNSSGVRTQAIAASP